MVATEDYSTQASAAFDYVAPTPVPAATPTEIPMPATATIQPTPTLSATLAVTGTPAAIYIPTSGPAPSKTLVPTPSDQPFVMVEPTAISAGLQLTVTGDGFPANTMVNIHLVAFGDKQDPAQEPARFAATLSDADGNCRTVFIMPDEWPDGTLIREGRILLLAAAADLDIQGSTLFNYIIPKQQPK